MTTDLDLARRKRLSLALLEAHTRVQDCGKAIRQNQLEMLEVRRKLVEAIEHLKEMQRRYDQAK